jgi:hypothetical protein
MNTNTSIQFSVLHTALQAWFAAGHIRFVAPIDSGRFQGCVLYVEPRRDDPVEISAIVRYTLRDEQGIILSRHELPATLQEWPLENDVNDKMVNTITRGLLGVSVPTPISTRVDPLDFN